MGTQWRRKAVRLRLRRPLALVLDSWFPPTAKLKSRIQFARELDRPLIAAQPYRDGEKYCGDYQPRPQARRSQKRSRSNVRHGIAREDIGGGSGRSRADTPVTHQGG